MEANSAKPAGLFGADEAEKRGLYRRFIGSTKQQHSPLLNFFICLSTSCGIISHSSNPNGTADEIRYTGLRQIPHTDARRHGYTWHPHARSTEPRSRLCQWSLPSGMRRPPRGCGSSQGIPAPLRLWLPPSGYLRPRPLQSGMRRTSWGCGRPEAVLVATTQGQRLAESRS
jgi:hypothetical protein